MLKAVYDSFELIPEWARQLYHQVSGKWEMKHTEIEGIAELTSPGLAANKEQILKEKKALEAKVSEVEAQATKAQSDLAITTNKLNTAEAKLVAATSDKETAEKLRQDAETRAAEAETELSKVKTPGTTILSSKDSENWKKYTAIGTPDDIEKIKSGYESTSQENRKMKFEKNISDVSKKSGLDPDAVNFVLSGEKGKGVSELAVKERVVKDEKTKKDVTVYDPYVVRQVQNGDSVVNEEVLFSEFVKDLPESITKTLFSTSKASTEDTDRGNVPDKKKDGFHLPTFSAQKANDEEGSDNLDIDKKIENMNSSRSTRQSPWAPSSGGTAVGAGK